VIGTSSKELVMKGINGTPYTRYLLILLYFGLVSSMCELLPLESLKCYNHVT
jgi:hypothetical protein